MKLIMVFGDSTLVNPYPPPSSPPHLILDYKMIDNLYPLQQLAQTINDNAQGSNNRVKVLVHQLRIHYYGIYSR